MLDAWRRRVARWIAPSGRVTSRTYAGARNSRLTAGFGTYANSSADTELYAGLTQLRARSRQLMRDAPYAARAKVIVVNNVVGAGVGMQAQVKNTRGELHLRINADIESAWAEWTRADSCHTGGALHFSDFERACLSEVFTAGEAFIRKHFRSFGGSRIPLALELIEAERMADEFTNPNGVTPNTKLGVEVDTFGRPVAYWVREVHPGELRFRVDQTTKLERVPASEIIHLHKVDRWPQTRGEPWLHSVLRKLNDMDEYSGSELTAARMSANFFATIESEGGEPDPLATDKQADGTKELNIEPGVIEQLAAGDQLKFHAPNRPNTALDPFMRAMLREVSAGVGVSYESLSRDYSQSNYSSSRLALLDDRDLWRVLQQWWVRSFREPLLREWMQAAVLSGAIPSISVEQWALDPDRFLAVSWKLRGWSWIDPTKEVEAYKEAIKAGLTSATRVIAQTADGADIEDIIEERKRELEMYDEAEVEVDTTVPEPVEPAEPAAAAPEAPDPEDAVDNVDMANVVPANDMQRLWRTTGRTQSKPATLSDVGELFDKRNAALTTAICGSFATALAESSRRLERTTSDAAESVRTAMALASGRMDRAAEEMRKSLVNASDRSSRLTDAVLTNTTTLLGAASAIADANALRQPRNSPGSGERDLLGVVDANRPSQLERKSAKGMGD